METYTSLGNEFYKTLQHLEGQGPHSCLQAKASLYDLSRSGSSTPCQGLGLSFVLEALDVNQAMQRVINVCLGFDPTRLDLGK